MKYQKMINLLDDTTNETSKFRTRNWVKINDELIGTCNAGNQVKFKTLMKVKFIVIISMYTYMKELYSPKSISRRCLNT